MAQNSVTTLEVQTPSSYTSKENEYLSDEVFSPVSSPNWKADSSASFLSVSPKLTLFQKAEIFRKENHDLWEKQCEEMEKRRREFNEVIPQNSFLDKYYEELDKNLLEVEKKKEIEGLEPPKLVIKYIYNLPFNSDDGEKEQMTYESLSQNVCVFDKEEHFFDKFRNDKNEARGSKPELIVTVKKGKNLFYGLKKTSGKPTYSSLKYSLFDINGKRKQKHKTEFIYVSKKGKARWSYNFVLKGFTQDELKNYYIIFKVTVKTEEDTQVIGDACVGGEEVFKDRKKSVKKLLMERTVAASLGTSPKNSWEEAIANPGKEINATLSLAEKKREPSFSNKKQEEPRVNVNQDLSQNSTLVTKEHYDNASPNNASTKETESIILEKNGKGSKEVAFDCLPSNNNEETLSSNSDQKMQKSLMSSSDQIKSKNSVKAEKSSSKGFLSQLKIGGKKEKNEKKSITEEKSPKKSHANSILNSNPIASEKTSQFKVNSSEETKNVDHIENIKPVNKVMPILSKQSPFQLKKDKVKVSSDQKNKLPPSSKMKVTPSKTYNVDQETKSNVEISKKEEAEKLKPVIKKSFFSLKSSPLQQKKSQINVTTDEINKLPPSSKMKITSTKSNPSEILDHQLHKETLSSDSENHAEI